MNGWPTQQEIDRERANMEHERELIAQQTGVTFSPDGRPKIPARLTAFHCPCCTFVAMRDSEVQAHAAVESHIRQQHPAWPGEQVNIR